MSMRVDWRTCEPATCTCNVDMHMQHARPPSTLQLNDSAGFRSVLHYIFEYILASTTRPVLGRQWISTEGSPREASAHTELVLMLLYYICCSIRRSVQLTKAPASLYDRASCQASLGKAVGDDVGGQGGFVAVHYQFIIV